MIVMTVRNQAHLGKHAYLIVRIFREDSEKDPVELSITLTGEFPLKLC